MHADHGPEETLGHAVGRLVAEGLLGVQIFVGHVEGFGPLVSIVVARSHLEGSTVRHDGVDTDGVPGSREGVPDGSLGLDDGQAQIVHEAVDDLQIFGNLPAGIVFVCVSRVGLKEVNLTNTDEGTGLLGLVAEGVHHLVNFQREVLVRANPQREHGVHGRLGCGSQEHGDVEVVFSGVLHPVDFFLEAALFVLVSQVIGINALFTGPLQASDQRVLLFEEVLRNE